MPYRSELIDDGTGLLRIGTGVVKGQEIIEAAACLTSAFDPGRITHGLVDFTQVTSFEVTTQEIQTITALNMKNGEVTDAVIVAIAAPDDIAFGMSRMYGSLIAQRGWIVHTYRTMAEARAWLESELAGKGTADPS